MTNDIIKTEYGYEFIEPIPSPGEGTRITKVYIEDDHVKSIEVYLKEGDSEPRKPIRYDLTTIPAPRDVSSEEIINWSIEEYLDDDASKYKGFYLYIIKMIGELYCIDVNQDTWPLLGMKIKEHLQNEAGYIQCNTSGDSLKRQKAGTGSWSVSFIPSDEYSAFIFSTKSHAFQVFITPTTRLKSVDRDDGRVTEITLHWTVSSSNVKKASDGYYRNSGNSDVKYFSQDEFNEFIDKEFCPVYLTGLMKSPTTN